jgi:hypothetical protein
VLHSDVGSTLKYRIGMLYKQKWHGEAQQRRQQPHLLPGGQRQQAHALPAGGATLQSSTDSSPSSTMAPHR